MIDRRANPLCLMMIILLAPCLARADFDERRWHKFAPIELAGEEPLPVLGTLSLEPWLLQEEAAADPPFADLRIVTDDRTEVPYQVVTREPETRMEELEAKLLNLSEQGASETYFELLVEKTPIVYNTMEIVTGETNFYAQVVVQGRAQGDTYTLVRGDAVIFDYSREESLRHTTITFPDSRYGSLFVKVTNNAGKPLKVTGVKLFYQTTQEGFENYVSGWMTSQEEDPKGRTTTLHLKLGDAFPVTKLTLETADKNFQRAVELYVKKGAGEWVRWTGDYVFKFETESTNESKLSLTFPEVLAGEMKCIVKNYDSPPVKFTGVSFTGYRKVLIFKFLGPRKYYLFWGNPKARAAQYDIAGLIAKYKVGDLRAYFLGPVKENPDYSPPVKVIPFTERYRNLLYAVIILLVIALLFLQYLVIKRTKKRGETP